MARATYMRAVEWLAANDDNEWLRDDDPRSSVTGSLVCDLYGKDDAEFRADLLKQLRHIHPSSWFGKMPWEAK